MNNKLFLWSLGVIGIFIALHSIFGARFDIFNLDRERTPAAIFSSLQFIASGYALCVISFLSMTRVKKMLWGTLGGMFVFLGLDEISELHENVAYYFANYFPHFSFFHSGTPMWVVFLSPCILGIFILLVIAVREIYAHSSTTGRVLIGGCIAVISALILEFLGGVTMLRGFLPFFVVIEESAELVAGTFFLWGFSTYARERFFLSFTKK
ncbi:MAG: hypothetical protein Q7R79_02925 [bacterium]|nr:hypothetical protein [bacterium]